MGENPLEYDVGTSSGEFNDDGSGAESGEEATTQLTKDVLLTVANHTREFFENVTTTTMMSPSTAASPVGDFSENPWRIGFLATKAILVLLLLTVVGTARRDFIKTFAFILVLPLLLEVGLDVYIEIAANLQKLLGTSPTSWAYYLGPAAAAEGHLSEIHGKEAVFYANLWLHYAGYRLYVEVPWMATTLFLVESYIFWTLLVSSIVLLHFAQKAVSRPEDIKYMPTLWPFLQAQALPLLLVALTAVFVLFALPSPLAIAVSVVLRIFAVALALILIAMWFASFGYYCYGQDEFTMSSPHSLVRLAKSRLFSVQFFVLVAHLMSVPFICWSAITLAEDVVGIFSSASFGQHFLSVVHSLFGLHLHFLILRPLLLPILCILLLPNLRKRFFSSFCPCCCRRQQ
ncbi:unnamed protein product, partial [Mesorhabditis spiculigera]